MNPWLPPSGTLVFGAVLAAALWMPAASLLAQTTPAADPTAAPALTDAEKRMLWLNSRIPAKPTPAPKPAATAPKVGFRSNPQLIAPRVADVPPARSTPAPQPNAATPIKKPELPIAKTPASPTPKPSTASSSKPTPAPSEATPNSATAKATPGKKRPGETRVAKSTPAASTPLETSASVAKSTPAPSVKATPTPVVAEATPTKKRGAGSPVAKSSPAPSPEPKATPRAIAQATPAPPLKSTPAPKATPTALARLTTPVTVIESPGRIRITEVPVTPPPKLRQAASLAFIPPNAPTALPTPIDPGAVLPRGRYPWKTNIVTTVFWIGEPPGGNNPTPNRSSSWDANWAQNYGGFDNPDPAARRNFIPVRFKPRQNPFYVALPYNDVTRGTTKPEARMVIPWFKSAFRREGESVCRDRWVAIRNHAGRVAYAQWSDCGPFRTDHWQYVFGNDRPKPNLNKGAGLDVSPAVRDYLGLDGNDLTDWKFVDVREVPAGPWTLHGSNNHFVRK